MRNSTTVKQFFSNKTSFSQYEEKVTQYPVVTIALNRQASEVKTEDVSIRFKTRGIFHQVLEIGENHLHNDRYNKTEKVILDSLQRFNGRKAFRIMQITPILKKDRPAVAIKIFLRKNILTAG